MGEGDQRLVLSLKSHHTKGKASGENRQGKRSKERSHQKCQNVRVSSLSRMKGTALQERKRKSFKIMLNQEGLYKKNKRVGTAGGQRKRGRHGSVSE